MRLKTRAGIVELNDKTFRKMLKYRKSGRRGLSTKSIRIKKKIVKENLLAFAIKVKTKRLERYNQKW